MIELELEKARKEASQIFVIHTCKTPEDGEDIFQAFKDTGSEGYIYHIEQYFHQPYKGVEGANRLVYFPVTHTLSGGYMSDNVLDWYRYIQLSKEDFINLIKRYDEWEILTTLTIANITKFLNENQIK